MNLDQQPNLYIIFWKKSET